MARIFAAFCLLAVLAAAGVWIVYDPDTPLPDEWNPTQPLRITDPISPLTQFKLTRALSSGQMCLDALATASVTVEHLDDFEESDSCHIKGRVRLSEIGSAKLRPVETRCAIALRTAMWVTHDLQPKAETLFAQDLAEINHFSSYNCRAIRTLSGATNRMSTHATAEALDVSGFKLSDGTVIDLKEHWNSENSKSEFLKFARDSACKWFVLTLSPDYNALHADHFHLQSTGWSNCR